jgi:uncharacterized protein YjiS (DUF1127 family)
MSLAIMQGPGTTGSLFSTVRYTVGVRPRAALSSMVEAVLEWQERGRQRQMLGRLDDRLLRDVGLTRSDVEQERAKSFWQA